MMRLEKDEDSVSLYTPHLGLSPPQLCPASTKRREIEREAQVAAPKLTELQNAHAVAVLPPRIESVPRLNRDGFSSDAVTGGVLHLTHVSGYGHPLLCGLIGSPR